MTPLEWAGWVNIVLVAVLVVITAYYAKKTAEIVEESRKARHAAERQADAAEHSLAALRQRFEEEAGLSKTIVATAIQTALRNIEYWTSANIFNLAATYALPKNINLVPTEDNSAIQHARRISIEASHELSGAFDSLRLATSELETMRDGKQASPDFYTKHGQRALGLIEAAKLDIETAQEHLQEAVRNQA